jgi:hypothetical protein
MFRNLSVTLLSAGALALGALGASTATAQACEGPYNDNNGYCTGANVSNYPNNNWRNQDRKIRIQVPYSNQDVWVPDYMRNFVWVAVRNEDEGFPYLDFRYWGPNPRQWPIPCVQEFYNQDFNYGAWRPGMFMIDGQTPTDWNYFN